MHSCMFLSNVGASPEGLNIYIALVSAALLGVSQRGSFSSHMFTPALWSGWNLPVWVCFMLQGVFQTPWPFGENSRAPIHSWGFPFQISLSSTSQRRLQSYRQFFSHSQFPHELLRFCFCLIHQPSCWFPFLSTGCCFTPLYSGGFLWALACPKRLPVFSRIR